MNQCFCPLLVVRVKVVTQFLEVDLMVCVFLYCTVDNNAVKGPRQLVPSFVPDVLGVKHGHLKIVRCHLPSVFAVSLYTALVYLQQLVLGDPSS